MAIERQTRIVATLGPSTDSEERLRAILDAGMDVARINCSHGSAEEHLQRIDRLRTIARQLGKNVAILADLPGPKLRVFLPSERELRGGDTISFSLSHTPVAAEDITITEPEMLQDVKPNERILLDDGRLQLVAGEKLKDRLLAKVVIGGKLLPKKGLNLPDTPLTIPALTDADRTALAFLAKSGCDWLALSFVRSAEAAEELRLAAKSFGLDVPLIAKMERPEAVERAEEIVRAFDGIMVARGDLGVEIPLERVPTVQKRLITLARSYGKPVITATDMLDSMRKNPRPTRAEASDVANAIYDGTDAIMLSGETAAGDYPVESVLCMSKIALEAESHLADLTDPMVQLNLKTEDVDDIITNEVYDLANKLKVDAIVTPTLSGRTARLIARHRPKAMVVAPSPSEFVVRQMALVWGLKPVHMIYCRRAGDDRMSTAIQHSFDAKVLTEGMRVLVLAGHPIEGGDYLPTIRLLKIGPDGKPVAPS
ncbi:pyruvate kinase [Telmatocola sphagniphila]|uniref:Pyruvate kinase n=1 Tax=Telmatocola sphagniphila TaxID=1123043 RepID=A0A8E6EYP6_9BACT|nr:pyruvate kinase [Telmatocola sphagniphila]QVL32888.1 pyruvate kinase [Telmatocola sphagniphila]